MLYSSLARSLAHQRLGTATGPHALAKEKLTRKESKIPLGNSYHLTEVMCRTRQYIVNVANKVYSIH